MGRRLTPEEKFWMGKNEDLIDQGRTPARGETAARWVGQCPSCGDQWGLGDFIVTNDDGDWVHEGCE